MDTGFRRYDVRVVHLRVFTQSRAHGARYGILFSRFLMFYTTLVSTEVLARHLDDPEWIIFDCRFTLTDVGAGQCAYDKAHIPGAHYVHLDNDMASPVTSTSGRHPLPDPEVLAHKLGNWGVNSGKQVVVYDDTFGAMAGRLWWLLRWLGHDNVALLDGVYPKWLREKLPVTDAVSIATPTRFSVSVRDNLWVDANDVGQMRDDKDCLLLDARAEERFSGEIEPLDPVAGHIPGAINLPWEDNLDFGGDFLSAGELRQQYAAQVGDILPGRITHMCGSGVTACHNILAMEHAGITGTRLYVGGWSEWITDKSRPVDPEGS